MCRLRGEESEADLGRFHRNAADDVFVSFSYSNEAKRSWRVFLRCGSNRSIAIKIAPKYVVRSAEAEVRCLLARIVHSACTFVISLISCLAQPFAAAASVAMRFRGARRILPHAARRVTASAVPMDFH